LADHLRLQCLHECDDRDTACGRPNTSANSSYDRSRAAGSKQTLRTSNSSTS
jgi:hypothetical protein